MMQLTFKGREEALVAHLPTTTKRFSKSFTLEDNVFIEGDNLDALKLLQSTHTNKIKMIYIDPPYNTRSKKMYKDSLKHDDWACMMYPRLMLARDLLRDDGVIFISIDDNEVHHLRMICDEIFGEGNFVGTFPRITKKSGKSSNFFAKNNDFVLLYAKYIDMSVFFREPHNDDKFNNKDEFFQERGFYKLNQTLDYDSLGYVKSLDYPIEINGKTYYAGGSFEEYTKRMQGNNKRADWGWRWSKKLFDFGYKNGFIVAKETKNSSRIYTKTYQKATIKKGISGYEIVHEDRTKAMFSLAFCNDVSNDKSRSQLAELVGSGIFEYPKPTALIKKILQISTQQNDIILDFFAGSCTTAHAVMKLNSEDGGNRKYIMVQLDEPCDAKSEAFKAGYKTIADIGRERIRRAKEKYGFKDSDFVDVVCVD